VKKVNFLTAKIFIVIVSLIFGLAAAVLITAFLDKVIWPSLFVGILFGFIFFIFCLFVLKRRIKIN